MVTAHNGLEMALVRQAELEQRERAKNPPPPTPPKLPPQKTRPKPKPNDPCPCGRLHEDGRAYKFKKCCGSVVGDLHYFVADINSNEALSNDDGRILVFRDHPTAAAAARVKGWLRDKNRACEIVPLNPEKWESFKSKIPYVLVEAREFDVGDKAPEPPEETPCPVPLEMPTLTTADEGS